MPAPGFTFINVRVTKHLRVSKSVGINRPIRLMNCTSSHLFPFILNNASSGSSINWNFSMLRSKEISLLQSSSQSTTQYRIPPTKGSHLKRFFYRILSDVQVLSKRTEILRVLLCQGFLVDQIWHQCRLGWTLGCHHDMIEHQYFERHLHLCRFLTLRSLTSISKTKSSDNCFCCEIIEPFTAVPSAVWLEFWRFLSSIFWSSSVWIHDLLLGIWSASSRWAESGIIPQIRGKY